MIGAYVDWREVRRLVRDVYRSRYSAALDAEERAAEVFASLARRVGHLATSDDDLSGPLVA